MYACRGVCECVSHLWRSSIALHFIFFEKKNRFIFICLCIQVCLFEWILHGCRRVWWFEEGIGFPGGGNRGRFDPCRFWERNPGSLEEPQVLVRAEPSLQPKLPILEIESPSQTKLRLHCSLCCWAWPSKSWDMPVSTFLWLLQCWDYRACAATLGAKN